MKKTSVFLPVLLTFPAESARQDAWGRLTRLTSGGAELSTAVRLLKDEAVHLSFEVGHEPLEHIRARVYHVEDDVDGYRLIELRFVDEVQRRRVAKVLTDVLARS
jgi:hypothetical protein